jgi:hypothetical protein
MTEIVNVVCLKWGSVYGPEYVNNLYNMVKRNLSLSFRFICMTEVSDGLQSAVETWPLPEFEEPPWEYVKACSAWRKLALFEPGLANMTGKVLFLDLDVVIVGNIDCFFSFTNQLAIIENWYQPNRLIGQASAICFEAGQPAALLENYLNDPLKVLKAYRTEQAYITGYLGLGSFKYFPDDWCRSFKKHCLSSGFSFFSKPISRIPDKAKIVVFHGCPNPPDAIKGQWGKKLPWYKRWYKRVDPTAWVAEHWQ